MDEESIKANLKSLALNDEQLAGRVRELEEMIDTRSTPFWKRILFRIDGWPPWYIVAEKPAGVRGGNGGVANGQATLVHRYACYDASRK